MSVFEVRTFTPSGVQDKIVAGVDVEFTDEFGTNGYVKISVPKGSPSAGLLADRTEIALFIEGVEVDNSRAVLQEHTGNESEGVDARGIGYVEVWGAPTLFNLLKSAIVYPELWPDTARMNHTFSAATPGTILQTLIQRAQTRGAISWLTKTTWNTTTATGGAAWGKTLTIAYDAGVTLQSVIENMQRLGAIEIRMSGRDLRVYNDGGWGVDRTLQANPVILRRGQQALDTPYSESSADVTNVLLVIGDEGIAFERSDATSVGIFGRLEAGLSQGGTKDIGTLTTLGDASLSRTSSRRGEYTVKVALGATGARPFSDYQSGDWVFLDRNGTPERYRVRQLSVTREEERWIVTITLNDKFAELDILTAKKVEGIIGGASQDTVQPAKPDTTDKTTPKPPTGVVASSSAYLDSLGRPTGQVSIGWAAPSENTDNTALDDLAGYRIYMRDDSPTARWRSIGTVESGVTSYTYSPVAVGTWYRFSVVAFDSTNHVSGYATEARIQIANDTTAPPAPSTPALSSRLSTVTVRWDGKDSGGAGMPPDLANVEIHVGTTTGFSPSSATLLGTVTAAGTLTYVGNPGDTVYFKAVAVDLSGNRSATSGTASIKVASVLDGDIAGGVGAKTYYQSAAPTGGTYKDGDFWIDTDDRQMYTWRSTPSPGWVSIRDAAITDAATAAANAEIAANAAQATANGKNRVTYSTSPASGANTVGDIWFQRNTAGQTIGMWIGAGGTTWNQSVLRGEVLANIDAGTITVGFLSAARIAAGSLTIGQTAGLQGEFDAIDSRGTDLVTNGTGLLGNNTNFSQFTFAGDAPTGAAGSFLTPLGNSNFFTDEFMPVDVNKKYRLSAQIIQTRPGVQGYAYLGLAPMDSAKQNIYPMYYMFISGTTTTLAQPLNPGDTTITLTSAAGWYGTSGKNAGASTHLRSIIWWDYVDPFGKAWPQETYSRNWSGSNYWADGGISGNVITLTAPYSGPARAAGTPLSNGTSGSTYLYGGAVNAMVPDVWTQYGASITGTAPPGAGGSMATGWPAGTAGAKIVFLPNLQLSGAPLATSQHALAAVSFSDTSAAAYDANNIGTTQIKDGAITTPKVGANQITALQMTMADLANMCQVDENTAGVVAQLTGSHAITGGWSTRTSNTSVEFRLGNRVGPIPFRNGERIRFTARMKVASGTAAVTPRVYMFNPSLGNSFVDLPAINVTATDSWYAVEGNVALPDDRTTYFWTLVLPANTALSIKNTQIYRMNAAELVVDGSIYTNKLAAGSVTTPILAARAATIDKIDVGAIDASKIQIGVLRTNLIPDPSFEERYQIGLWDALGPAGHGDVDQWRRVASSAPGSIVTRYTAGENRARSGAQSLRLETVAGNQEAGAISGGFPVKYGRTYRIVVNCYSIGSSATLGVQMFADAASRQKLFTGFEGQVLTTDTDYPSVPVLPAHDPNGFFQYSYLATPTWSGGVNGDDGYAAIRFINYNSPRASTLVVDDVSCIETGIGGASEWTAAGLRLFNDDGMEVGAFVSNRKNYFSVSGENADGNSVTLAAVDENGDMTIQSLQVNADPVDLDGDGRNDTGLIIYGTEFTDWFDALPKGLVAFGVRSVTLAYTSTEAPFQELGYATPPGGGYRAIRITVTGGVQNDTANGMVRVSLRVTTDGSAPTTSSGRMMLWDIPPSGAAGRIQSFSNVYATAHAPGVTYRYLVTVEPLNGGNARFYSYPQQIIIDDMGPMKADTGVDRSGGTPPPAVTKQNYVTTWTSTGQATYRSDGSRRTDTSDVVQGYSSYNGNGKGIWLFPSSMQSALSGATITKVEVYAYANHWWFNSGGTARIACHGYSSAPGSSPSMTYVTQSTSWPKPGGRWVTLPSSVHSSFASGAYKGFGMGPGPNNDLIYYGRFNGGSGAKIRVSYTK